jgi:ELWxxDGT repeat protein
MNELLKRIIILKSWKLKCFPLFFVFFITTSCFDGLGPLSEEPEPDYSANYAKLLTISVDHDIDEDEISYTLLINKASDESRVGHYAIYWGDSAMNILDSNSAPIKTYAPSGYNIEDTISFPVPAGAVFLLLYTKLTENNISSMSASAAVEDLIMKRVTDINTSGNSSPDKFVIYNNKLYFIASDGITGTELWSIDADNVVTGPLTDINPSASSYVGSLALFNNRIYFSARGPLTGNELYYYDGVDSHIVSDHILGPGSLYPEELTVCGDKLFFRGTISSGIQLLSVDTDHNYTEIVVNSSASSYPVYLTTYNNILFFNANSASSGTEKKLFRYDGTLSVIDINGMANPNPGNFTSFNGELYFYATDNLLYGQELWSYNGSSVELVSDIKPGIDSSQPGGLHVFNGRLYFSAEDEMGDGRELWFYDGDSFGHFNLVPDLIGATGSYPYHSKCEYNGYLFFEAYQASTNYELWVYRGSGIPEMITDLQSGTSSSDIDNFTVYNNKLYFSADDGINGKELWVLYFK